MRPLNQRSESAAETSTDSKPIGSELADILWGVTVNLGPPSLWPEKGTSVAQRQTKEEGVTPTPLPLALPQSCEPHFTCKQIFALPFRPLWQRFHSTGIDEFFHGFRHVFNVKIPDV